MAEAGGWGVACLEEHGGDRSRTRNSVGSCCQQCSQPPADLIRSGLRAGCLGHDLDNMAYGYNMPIFTAVTESHEPFFSGTLTTTSSCYC